MKMHEQAHPNTQHEHAPTRIIKLSLEAEDFIEETFLAFLVDFLRNGGTNEIETSNFGTYLYEQSPDDTSEDN